MAEFSKQWCELHDSVGIQPDFDIDELAEQLENNHYFPYICEGFGFIAIGKDMVGNTILAFRDDGEDSVTWKKYEDVIK